MIPAANALWFAASLPEWRRYQRDCSRVAATQERVLLDIIRENESSKFGRRRTFAGIRSIENFQQQVPLSTYGDYGNSLQQGWLTAEPIELLQPTSGSSSTTKLIPYTAALRSQYQRAIQVWIADLFLNHPALLSCQSYWSISPAMNVQANGTGDIRVGFDDDTAYLGVWERRFAQSVLAVPPEVRHAEDIESFRYLTLLFLLRAEKLGLLSVWNPTFFSLLLDKAEVWAPSLIEDIHRGGAFAGRQLAPDPARARQLRAIFSKSGPPDWAAIWPHLHVLSCWTDANAALYASQLAKRLPHCRMQGKGLLATEGVVSIPLAGREGCALAFRSHFFEFLPVTSDGIVDTQHPRLAHELDPGQRYTVVLTTGGGLYRYQLGDLIRPVGRIRECPLIRFEGRHSQVSDWFGEKLHETHVREALTRALAKAGVEPEFCMLACDTACNQPAYVVYIETGTNDEDRLTQVAAQLESALGSNFHYAYARQLGQLGPVLVFRIQQDGLATYLEVCRQSGQRLGDIKPAWLDRRANWSAHFRGTLLQPSSQNLILTRV